MFKISGHDTEAFISSFSVVAAYELSLFSSIDMIPKGMNRDQYIRCRSFFGIEHGALQDRLLIQCNLYRMNTIRRLQGSQVTELARRILASIRWIPTVNGYECRAISFAASSRGVCALAIRCTFWR